MSIEKLNELELKNIEEYRSRHSTSVLTIMFTDIEGFTEMTESRGDQYSSMIRHLHDQILEKAIEGENDGKVIKHIGDAIMAVFSEPSKAVTASLKIQKDLRQFNKNKPEGVLDNLKVRIGLHMGQVATEQNKGQKDIFGRHVNRASRVESMASGGQIFCSSSVYDSAKGWVQKFENHDVQWTAHGKYKAKGINEGIDIFEVSEANQVTHRAPKKNQKMNSTPKALLYVIFAAALVILAFGGFFVFKTVEKPDVTFLGDELENIVLDGTSQLLIQNNHVVSPISAGHHIFSYHRSNLVRLYMEADIKAGKNTLQQKFVHSQMPETEVRWEYGSDPLPEVKSETKESFISYGPDLKKEELNAELSVKVLPKPASEGPPAADFKYEIKMNGKTVAESSGFINEVDKIEEKETEVYRHNDFVILLGVRKLTGVVVVSLHGDFLRLNSQK